MTYGYFDDQHKEYIITNPKTPVKWINYIGGLSFGGFIDQTGGSLICKGDPATNRIVKYIPQLPASSFKGETLYIRIKENGSYKLFSPFFVPTLDSYDLYECHVGMGYSTYISEFYGIKTEITIFVPKNDHRVIRDIKVTNQRKTPVEIDLIPLVEYTHFDAMKQFNNADWVPQTMMSEVKKDSYGHLTLLQYAFMKKESAQNFFTSNHLVSSFETDRSKFLGDHEYGTFMDPLSLKQEELGNHVALRGDNIASFMHHLDILEPNETKRVITQLGQCDNYEKELEDILYFYQEEHVDQAFNELKTYWHQLLNQFQIQTPSKEMNSMINIFNPRQCNTTLNWSRYLSLYQLGLGARGIGFRDSCQDIMGAVSHTPETSKNLLIKLIQMQKRDGSAIHQFNPLSMLGNEGDSLEEDDRYHFYGDDHLWLILSVCTYLKETGDIDFLQTSFPYYDKDKKGKALETSTLLEHLKRALGFTKEHTGKHGLPLLGFADWNDTVNLPKGAESIFIANLYGVALLEMIELLNFLGDQEQVKFYDKDYQEMKERVNKHAWDGNWYIRYFDHLGKPIGSKENDEGKIYTNAQSWSILSGFATPERANIALESVKKYLNTKNGIKLSTPGYSRYDHEKGGVTSYPPGAKENGGIFLHSNPWVMIAETMLGHGNQAFEYYDQINPASKNDRIDEFECEPYVYPQNILGNEHPQFGLGRNSWLSGTASWTYQAATQYILGIKPTYTGLQINPTIPNSWEKYSVKKVFRGSIYHIDVFNLNQVETGVVSISIDNKLITGKVLPIFNDQKEHYVKVVLG